MQLLQLTLTDFRNYKRCVWNPTSPFVILHGENGSGKTNLLEALSLLAPGRGLHGASSAHFCREGAHNWGISASLKKGEHVFRLATGTAPSNTKRRVFLVEGEPVRSQSDVASLYACVWLVPRMDRLLSDNAAHRRRFLDRLVVALFPDHAQQLAAHERSVMSRNRILATQPSQKTWLSSVEDSISRHAVAITDARLTFLERMKNSAITTPGFPEIDLQLDCLLAQELQRHSALKVEDWLRDNLQKTRTDDQQRGGTRYGAHRADFSLNDTTHGIRGALASSGQQKIMLLSLLLAHAHCVQEGWGDAPFLLLDEPLVHLDEPHRQALMTNILERKMPSFLTGTDAGLFAPLKSSADFVHVKNGFLHPEAP
ncbi:DNA replication/repair protein RecF [Saccharibacter sp. 17.LH.SD]|uniref:DNA replication/repair protein RecF n=1 Tax=Saccharibacter sp. 17.LH.SD TaxID=2689393 RepID=UPI00136D08F9|nr:DNA replication/repair protein RecF [Saccharibacter sp. 17.LH.SD]MXV44451.1 DNA replication/repair protein RecF [Saccharibacter sp. 17.LH.SD]